MIFKHSQNSLSRFDYCHYLCDEIFVSHPTFKDKYMEQQPSLSFANEIHSWLLSNVIWKLEKTYGGIIIQTIPVKSKNENAFCAVRVERKTDDRVFANMVHRAIVSVIEKSFSSVVIYYRLREKETLFEEGIFFFSNLTCSIKEKLYN